MIRSAVGSGWEECESLDVQRADDVEMASIKRRQLGLTEALCNGEYGCVDEAKWQIRVRPAEGANPGVVLLDQVDDA